MLLKRYGILWLLIALFLWLVASRYTEIQQLAATLASGKWQWIIVAVVLTVALYIVRATLYQAVFHTVEVNSRIRDLFPLVFASIFMNVVVPSGGVSSAALFIDDAGHRGESPARTAAGTVLFLVTDLVAFSVVLVVGMVYLFIQHDLHIYQVIGFVLLFGLILGLTGVLLLALWRPDHLLGVFSRLQQTANRLALRLSRPPFLADTWAKTTAAEFTDAATAISTRPYRLVRALVISFGSQLVQLACLLALFRAFSQRVGPGALVAGYAIGVLFWIVSITPQGIGVVEGVMTLVFTSLGIPPVQAALITLSFRGLVFWLPFAIGFLSLRRLKTFRREPSQPADRQSVVVVMLLAGLAGITGLYSEATQALPRFLPSVAEFLSRAGVQHGGYLAAALGGFTLFLLATDLLRRN